MSEPTKYLIVSVDHDDYGRHIQQRRLDPGRCFQCLTVDEAYDTSWRNEQWGIVCDVQVTEAWTARHGHPRTGEAA